jgi:hypothetical protein
MPTHFPSGRDFIGAACHQLRRSLERLLKCFLVLEDSNAQALPLTGLKIHGARPVIDHDDGFIESVAETLSSLAQDLPLVADRVRQCLLRRDGTTDLR